MKLSGRDRAKVNAALLLLKDAGHDTGEVLRVAQAGLEMGTPPRQSFERAFNQFVARVPAMTAPLKRLGQLIEASDERTVAGYNAALTRFGETGDPATLQAMMGTLQQDMRAMAQLTGDAGFAEGLDDAPAAPQPTTVERPAEALGASPAPTRPGHGPTGYSPAQSAETHTAPAVNSEV